MLLIRWMIKRDMDEVLAIERSVFSYPWDEAEFLRHLGCHKCIGLSIDLDDRVVGYAVYRLYPRAIELLHLGIDPASQRSGLGAAVIGKLKAKLRPGGRDRIVTFVSERNLAGHWFFHAMGFRSDKVSMDRFEESDGPVDAYRFVYKHPKVSSARVSDGELVS